MPVKITLTIEPSDLWGADEFYRDGGDEAIKEMALEYLSVFIEEAKWKIEYTQKMVDSPHVPDWNFVVPATLAEICKVLRCRIDVHKAWAEYLEANADSDVAKSAIKAGVGAVDNHRLYIQQYEAAIELITACGETGARE